MAAVYLLSQEQIARAAARRAINEQYMVQDNRATGKRIDAITRQYPHLNAATAMALAEAGYEADSVEVRTVGNLQAKRDAEGGWWGDVKRHWNRSVERVAKTTVRTGLTAMGAPYEYLQGTFRSGVTGIREGDVVSGAAGVIGFASPLQAAKKGYDLATDDEGTNPYNQTRLGAAVQVSKQAGVSVPDALNNIPQIGPDGDPTSLLEREQQTWLPGPNSLAEKQQVANARNAGTLNGRATTFGRTAGWLVGLEPGGAANRLMHGVLRMSNNPMLEDNDNVDAWLGHAQMLFEGGIDLGAAFTLDPLGRASAGRARQVSQGLSEGGRAGRFGGATVAVPQLAKVTDKASGKVTAVPVTVDGGPRPTVVHQNAADWLLQSKQGDRFANYAAAETNYERLAAVLGRDTHPTTILRLIDAQDPVTAKQVLLEEMGKGFVDRTPRLRASDLTGVGLAPTKVAGVASALTRRSTARWSQLAPSETMGSREDPAWAVEQYRRMAHAMRTGVVKDDLSLDFISRNVEEFARGLVDPDADWSVPYRAMMGLAKDSLRAHGVDRQTADHVTGIWQQRITTDRAYWIDRHTGAAKDAFATVDGDDIPLSKAAASAEFFTDGIPFINTQEFAKAASRARKLYASPGWETVVSIGDLGTAFFKFMVLPVRGGAWMMRNLAEAQARVTVEGLPGIFNSPLLAMAWRMGDSPRSTASRMLGRDERMARYGIGQYDAAAEDFRLRGELEANGSQWAKSQEHKGGPWNDEHMVVYSSDFGTVRRDEPNSYGAWLDGQRFTLGKLAGSPEYRMAVDAETPLHAKNMFWKSDIRRRMAQREPSLNTREGADAYMDNVYRRITEATNDNPDLRQAIATGRLNGVLLIERNARGNMVWNQKALKELEKYHDDLPEWVVTPNAKRMQGDANAVTRGVEAFERQVMARTFAWFGSMPNNRFVNSPTFRQLHWQQAERLATLGTAEARAALVANARKARMPQDVIRRLEAVSGPPGQLDVTDIRDLADAKAFNGWMDIVYNSHNKGNWTRSVRMISPFAAAVADMYRFWGKRLAKNPLVLHRVEQGMHGARQSGFVFNDENGEERFAYPMTRALSRIVAGVDRSFTGSVKGANMITSSVLPSVGPVISWPVAAFLPDTPETDALRELINPYGDPDARGGILEGFAPSHVQRILAVAGLSSPEQQRRYQESVADAMAYLASTGDYGNSEDEQRRLREDAKRKGRALYLVQAFAQSGVPASPRGDTLFKDPTGRAIQLAHIGADYRKMMREDPDTATQRLLQKYGDAVFLAVTGGTEGSTAFATEESHDLAREHPEVVEKYGAVWSYFTDPNSPYSHEEFRRQLSSGERTPRSLRARQVAAQTSLATNMYMGYKRQFGPFPTTEEREYLKTVKAAIAKELPLWDQTFNAMEVQTRVEQTFRAAKDPAFRDTEVAQAVLAYQQARAQVRDHYNQAGVTDSESGWGRAKAAEEGRDYLRQVAVSLIDQVPQFQTMWERVFDAEMVDDVEGAVE